MNRKKVSLVIIALALVAVTVLPQFAPTIHAEIGGYIRTLPTASADTFSFSRKSSISIYAPSANTSDIYYRIFWCNETSAAASASSTLVIHPGQAYNYVYDYTTESGDGYCYMSLYTAGASQKLEIQLK